MLESVEFVWLIAGTALILMEFLVPGVVLLFFGFGAWIVVPIVYFFDISFNVQLILFLVFSLASLFLLRGWVAQKLNKRKDTKSDFVLQEHIGKTALVHVRIAGEGGRVAFQGSYWQARAHRAEESIAAGQRVRIVDVDNKTFIVEKV